MEKASEQAYFAAQLTQREEAMERVIAEDKAQKRKQLIETPRQESYAAPQKRLSASEGLDEPGATELWTEHEKALLESIEVRKKEIHDWLRKNEYEAVASLSSAEWLNIYQSLIKDSNIDMDLLVRECTPASDYVAMLDRNEVANTEWKEVAYQAAFISDLLSCSTQ